MSGVERTLNRGGDGTRGGKLRHPIEVFLERSGTCRHRLQRGKHLDARRSDGHQPFPLVASHQTERLALPERASFNNLQPRLGRLPTAEHSGVAQPSTGTQDPGDDQGQHAYHANRGDCHGIPGGTGGTGGAGASSYRRGGNREGSTAGNQQQKQECLEALVASETVDTRSVHGTYQPGSRGNASAKKGPF